MRPPRWLLRLAWPAVLATTLGVAYTTTLLPDVGYETDTAKFDYLGRVLGTGHAPGYPLYTMLNAAFVRLVPVGTLALRANLLSAVCAVIACVLLYAALVELDVDRPVAAAGAAVFGLSRTFWSQAVVAEVYALHVLFVAAVLLLLLRWARSRRDRDLLVAVAVYALSFSHHLSTGLLAPGVAWFVLRADPTVLARVRVLAALPVVGLAGLLPYGYLFWRTADPALAYREVEMRDLASFWAAFTGGGFRGQMFAFGPRTLLTQRLALFAGLLRAEPLLAALPPAAVGVARLGGLLGQRGRGPSAGTRSRVPAGGLLLLWAAVNTVWALGYDVPDVQVFFIPTYFVLAVWATVGADVLVAAAPGRLATLALALVLAAPALLAWANHAAVDLSGDRTADEVRAALARMADGGVVFTYHLHHFNYFLAGLGWSADHAVYPQYPLPWQRISAYCSGEPVEVPHVGRSAPAGLPVYAYGQAYVDQLRAAGFELAPVGGELWQVRCATPLPAPQRRGLAGN